ncbi:LemA family protein [Zobellia galactanivorans]|uniref:LemA family protein, N-terminal n=1 Tax=Zobellia galactanivorans (strain DSM 12802 / CCUG 47099 / CIP 106680 / NCIMB 13871 / Dsij) TaxID=63186 RepID=G0L9D0_ZOBGA|nr:LemA family protein [Zobellia galactanivorans]CAZ94488.1 LemA family protein, N-terminal fragment [Zobellia galactanivorans]
MNSIILIIVLALILVYIVSSGIKIYNRLVILNQNVDKNFANIDVLLKQRADEIPELVKIVKSTWNTRKACSPRSPN